VWAYDATENWVIWEGVFLQGEEEVVAVMLQTGGDEEKRDADEGSCSGRVGELEVGEREGTREDCA
jgi:hypothetical protein